MKASIWLQNNSSPWAARNKTDEEKQVHRIQLTLNLVSMLTLNPNDTEAVFHLANLADNSDTVAAAIRYAEDMKMPQEKLFELRSLQH